MVAGSASGCSRRPGSGVAARIAAGIAAGLHGRLAAGLLVVLAIAFLVLGAIQAWEDAPTFDEPLYVVAGVAAWERGELELNYEHPPLAKLLAAAPVAALVDLPIPYDDGAYARGDPFMLAARVFAADPDSARLALFAARIPALLLCIGVAVLLGCIGHALFGRTAGHVAAALWLTQPAVLGLGHLDGLDVPGAFVVVMAVHVLVRYLAVPSPRRAVEVGLAAGCALVTRGGVGPVVVLACVATISLCTRALGLRRAAGAIAVVLLVAWACVWAVYLPFEPCRVGAPSGHAGLSAEILLRVPWPSGFAASVHRLGSMHTTEPVSGYLFGEIIRGAPPWFWLGSFALKVTPIVLLAMVLGAWGWTRMPGEPRRRAAVVLLPMTLLLAAMLAQAVRPLGFRYVIVLVAMVMLLVAPCASVIPRASRRFTLGLALGLQLVMLWRSHPCSFAWGTPLAPAAWRLAIDSNVDWGQDLHRLEAWALEHPGAYVSYFGPPLTDWEQRLPGTIPARTGYPWEPMAEPPADIEWIAVSASSLNLFDREQLPALRGLCPVDLIGGSILVYRVRPGWRRRGAPTTGLPRDSCLGAAHSE